MIHEMGLSDPFRYTKYTLSFCILQLYLQKIQIYIEINCADYRLSLISLCVLCRYVSFVSFSKRMTKTLHRNTYKRTVPTCAGDRTSFANSF